MKAVEGSLTYKYGVWVVWLGFGVRVTVRGRAKNYDKNNVI